MFVCLSFFNIFLNFCVFPLFCFALFWFCIIFACCVNSKGMGENSSHILFGYDCFRQCGFELYFKCGHYVIVGYFVSIILLKSVCLQCLRIK